MTSRVWVVSYEENWGTRQPRYFRTFLVSREPTPEEAIAILQENGIFMRDISPPGPVQIYRKPVKELP